MFLRTISISIRSPNYTHQFKKNVLAETISKSLKNLLNYTPPSLFPVSVSLLFFLSLAHTLWRYENTRFATPLITVGERRGEKMRHYQTQWEIVGARHIKKRDTYPKRVASISSFLVIFSSHKYTHSGVLILVLQREVKLRKGTRKIKQTLTQLFSFLLF